MKMTAQAGQGSVPGRGHHSDAPTHTGKEPSAPSLSQGSATSFPTGKCLRGWEGAGSEHSDLPSLESPHTWVEADAPQLVQGGCSGLGELPNLCGLLIV